MSVYRVEDRTISPTKFPWGTINAERLDLYYNSVSLLVPFDSVSWTTDLSPRTKVLTTSNYVSQYTDFASFGGINTYLTTPSHDDFKFRTGDFTIECWLYIPFHRNTGYWTADSAIFGPSAISANGSMSYITNDGVTIGVWDGSPAAVTNDFSPIPIQQWIHTVWMRANGYMYFFLNGIKSTGTLYNKDQNPTSSFRIGGYCLGNNARYFLGGIRDLRVTKGVARYLDNFTPILPGYLLQTIPTG